MMSPVNKNREALRSRQGSDPPFCARRAGRLLHPVTAPLPSASDAELLRLIASGDRRALHALYNEHAGWLLIRLQRRCDDPDLADLALQDTFLAVWKSASKWRGDGDVGAWLWGIASRRLIDQLRKKRPFPANQLHREDDEPSAEQIAIERQLSGPIARAIAQLDPDLRTVFLAANLDGLTTKEIAVLHGMPQGTVKTRLARARTQLQGSLSPATTGDVA